MSDYRNLLREVQPHVGRVGYHDSVGYSPAPQSVGFEAMPPAYVGAMAPSHGGPPPGPPIVGPWRPPHGRPPPGCPSYPWPPYGCAPPHYDLPAECFGPGYPHGWPAHYPPPWAFPWGLAAAPGDFHVDVSQYGRPVAPRMKPIDFFDATFQGALRERGQGLGEATMVRQALDLVAGNQFVMNATAPMSFTLTSLTVNQNAATFLDQVLFQIGGQPVLSYAGFTDLTRFIAGSFDKRVPAISVPAGTSVTMVATVRAGAPAAPNNQYIVAVEGLPIRQALSQSAA